MEGLGEDPHFMSSRRRRDPTRFQQALPLTHFPSFYVIPTQEGPHSIPVRYANKLCQKNMPQSIPSFYVIPTQEGPHSIPASFASKIFRYTFPAILPLILCHPDAGGTPFDSDNTCWKYIFIFIFLQQHYLRPI